MIDKLLIFDLIGKFACWKKFYSNSSSFTYDIPTRTQLIGIFASILEMPKDSYYDEFSSENCKISLRLNAELRKKFYCLNYFKTPNERDYTQVRLELLSGLDIKKSNISYRVYVSLKDQDLFNSLIEKIKNNSLGYGVSLGQQQFRGDIEFVGVVEEINLLKDCNEINSICNVKNIYDFQNITDAQIIIEKMPMDFIFVGNENELRTNLLNRELSNMSDIAYSKNINSFKISTKFKKALEIKYNNCQERLCFYEDDF